MKLVVLGGIVSYIVGPHKYYEPKVLPAETDKSSNIFPINMFELLNDFTPTMLSPLLNLLLWTYGAMKFCWHKFKSICMIFMELLLDHRLFRIESAHTNNYIFRYKSCCSIMEVGIKRGHLK